MSGRTSPFATRWIVIGSIALFIGLFFFGLIWLNRPRVTVTRVVEGAVVNAFYATGTVQPATEYPIKTSNAGTVTQLWVEKGDHVVVEQKLAVVEDPQMQFELDKAAANLKQATERADEKRSPVLKEYDARLEANVAMLENAHHELDRLTDMSTKGGASKTDVEKAADHLKELSSLGLGLGDQRDAARLQLNADLEVAQAAWRAAKANVDLQTLVSPIAGVVLDRPAPLHTRLAVNQNDHVMQLADVSPGNLRMRAAVDEENIAEVSDDQLVEMVLYSFPGRTFQGHVTKRYPKADAERRTFEVDIAFSPPDPKIAAGMTGELAFIVQQKDRAMIAPAQALQGDALYTIHDGRLVRVEKASIGIKGVERVEILSGLNIGDTVVISPVQDIAPGRIVRVTMLDPVAAAGLNKPTISSVSKNPLGDH